jgi:moderate conductance mechanosensitive channel
MREWLQRILPAAPWRSWLIDAADAAVSVLWVILLFLVVRSLALRALQVLMARLEATARREGDTSVARLRTLEGLARSIITNALLFVASVTLLGEVGVNIAAILASAGVAGLALSFGAQRLVRDVITGFFLLLEDQFRVGEVVTLVGSPGLPQLTGTILEMGLRITRLQDVSGKLVTIGNGDIAAVINHSRGPISATVEFGVPPDVPVERIREILARMPLDDPAVAGPAGLDGVTQLEAERIVLRAAAPARPGQAPEAELALRQAIGEAMRQAGVEIK